MSFFGSINFCQILSTMSESTVLDTGKGKAKAIGTHKLSRSIQYSILDLTDDEQTSEDSDSESKSDSSISGSDLESDSESSDDGEEKRIKAYVASIFEEKNKQKAVETIQSTGEEDVITLPDETLP